MARKPLTLFAALSAGLFLLTCSGLLVLLRAQLELMR